MKENFFHGMLLGLLLEIPALKTGCIIEVKYAENGQYDKACTKAMKQMEDDGYAEVLRQDGMQIIHKYGMACYKKSCRVSYCMEKNSESLD